uniref:Transducin beta-like protein 2 n=1 Tax=Hirondellea gigas TaxID=1518452 RepID=A0A2P2I2E0_9CRUS
MAEIVVDSTGLPVGLIIFAFVCCALFGYIYSSLFKQKPEPQKKENQQKSSQVKSQHTSSNKTVHATKAHKKTVYRAPKHHQFSSPALISTFKGHTDTITSGAVSANGKGLVTAALDRTLFFYNLREAFSSGASSIQGTRSNIQYDHVSKLCWSPDYAAIVVQKNDAATLQVIKGTKKTDGTLTSLNTVREFPKPFPDHLVGLEVAGNGKFIMTCAGASNLLSLWDLHGNLLGSVDTKQGHTLHAVVSIDDRFIATSGFTPEVKVFEVIYDKCGDFKSLNKAFELTGHNSRIFGSHFSPDSNKMATVSKDGTWNLYDTNVDYQQGQRPSIITSGSISSARSVEDREPCIVRLSPDTRVVLVTAGASLYCYSSASGVLVHNLDNIYAGPILNVFFDAGNQFFLTLGDHQGHLFHNVAGHHATIQELEVSLKAATYSGLRDRIRSQLEGARKALAKLEAKAAQQQQNNSSSKKSIKTQDNTKNNNNNNNKKNK